MASRPAKSPRPGQRLTRARAHDSHASVRATDPVMNAAARFLEARPRSVAETRRRLVDAGYPAPLVDEVLLRLADLGYLDDESFARAWVESRDRAHPRGEAALRRELSQKGIRHGRDRRGTGRATGAGPEARVTRKMPRPGHLARRPSQTPTPRFSSCGVRTPTLRGSPIPGRVAARRTPCWLGRASTRTRAKSPWRRGGPPREVRLRQIRPRDGPESSPGHRPRLTPPSGDV